MSKKRRHAAIQSSRPSKRQQKHIDRTPASRNPHAGSNAKTPSSTSKPGAQSKPGAPRQLAPAVQPFKKTDSVLLIGEADFSFARALQTIVKPKILTATSYDSQKDVLEKYKTTAPEILEALGRPVKATRTTALHDVDATRLTHPTNKKRLLKPVTSAPASAAAAGNSEGRGLGRTLIKPGYTKIAFLFPHVGGKSKDVIRQARLNQQLLDGFFKEAEHLLAANGRIVVTLFEGEAYDRWDIKGVAKARGYATEISGRWDWEFWGGYEHRRTLGEVEGGGGWKGGERKARCYVFGRKKELEEEAKKPKKKKKGGDESSDDESDSDAGGEGWWAQNEEEDEGEYFGSENEEEEEEKEEKKPEERIPESTKAAEAPAKDVVQENKSTEDSEGQGYGEWNGFSDSS